MSRTSSTRIAAAVLAAGAVAASALLATGGGGGSRQGVVGPGPLHHPLVYQSAGGNDTTCRRNLRGRPCLTVAKACSLARPNYVIYKIGSSPARVAYRTACSGGGFANWFVSPSGSDSNSGTDAGHPFLTLSKAYRSASCGQTVQLTGTFTAPETIFETRHGCADGTYVTYQGPANFQQATGTPGTNAALVISTADIRLTNVTFTETLGVSGHDSELGVVSSCGTTYGAQNIAVDHVAGTHFAIISAKNVDFHDNTWNYVDDWATGGSHIYPKGGCANSLDYPGDNLGVHLHQETWQQSEPGSHCAAANGGPTCHLDCLTIASASPSGANPGDSVHVERSTFKSCNDIDVWWKRVAATGANTTLGGMLIENNDLQAPDNAPTSATTELNCVDLSGDLVENSAYRYNSLEGTAGKLHLGTANCTFSNVKIVGNIVHAYDGCGTSGVTYGHNYTTSTACTGDTQVGSVTAMYVSDATMNLHLANGAAAIQGGDNAFKPTLDFDGNVRPVGTTTSSGAHDRS